jgi:cell division protease FtsH
MLARLATLYGGRIAEEIVLGDITSGASSDILLATKLARNMVCDWGMSPLGPVAYGENHDTVFLGREITRSENFSEETARLIDIEIRKLIDEQYSRARSIILEKRAALDKIAEALLQYETIEGRHVREILEYGEIRSPVLPPIIAAKPEDALPGKKPAEKAVPKSLPGDAPAPAPSPA